MKWFLAGVAWMGIVAACGASKNRPMVAAPESHESVGGAPSMPGEDKRAQIEELYAKVEKERDSIGLSAPSAASLPTGPMTPMTTVPMSTDQSCKPAKTDKCTNSCTFSDSICENAKKICDLADSMDGDAWAADKCKSAKQTCDTAHDTCCNCQ